MRRSGEAILALLAAWPVTGWGAAADVDALLEHLARPAPAATPFIEVHFSQLLARPLVISGKLEYLGPDGLARTVEQPYHERTAIHGDTVTVEREHDKPRQFSLKHAPELKSLLGSFAALLSGDRTALRSEFDLDLQGEGEAWTLALTPRDAHVRKRIESITVIGQGNEPRCLNTREPGDNATVMLVGPATQTTLPALPDRASLDRQCRGGGH
jgi:hypothetical protein